MVIELLTEISKAFFVRIAVYLTLLTLLPSNELRSALNSASSFKWSDFPLSPPSLVNLSHTPQEDLQYCTLINAQEGLIRALLHDQHNRTYSRTLVVLLPYNR
jgi:hypothetical protein